MNFKNCYNLIKEFRKYPLSRMHSMILKMSISLTKLFCSLGPKASQEDYIRWKEICEEILQFLSMIDPGTTKVMATFLLQHNKAKLILDKLAYEEGNLSRTAYLESIKENVILENRAQKVLTEIYNP